MQYFSEEAALYLSMTSNLAYAVLFIFHFVKKNSNKSLMVVAGCMCLHMVFIHGFLAYMLSFDKSTPSYLNLIVDVYLIWIAHSAVTSITIFVLHKLSKVKFHYNVRYVFYGLMVITLLNFVMYIDIIVMGNREAYWLWTVFSYGENIVNLFILLSILIARQWSEVFKWLQLAHSR